jgi:[ribosomal protein S5]-alanine N-acetyltransferase
MPACRARPLIRTDRLLLHATDPVLAPAVADYYRRNAAHFARWDPPLPPDHARLPCVAESLTEGRRAFDEGRSLRWWLEPRAKPGWVIGSVHLSGIARGPFHSCALGYGLDLHHTGRGLMHEALSALLDEAFSPAVNLHRVQAAIRPENQASLRVVERLGFHEEGLARDYLYIDGAWRDHRLFALLNPGFIRPDSWPRAVSAPPAPSR